MAKSFLDKFLDFAGFSSPSNEGHYHPSMYRDESQKTPTPKNKQTASKNSGVSGVEKYLQKKEKVSAKKKTPAKPALTGVEKYLAKKEQVVQQQKKEHAERLVNMTGVERYLAKLEKSKPVAKAKTVKKIETFKKSAEVTGVSKNLEKQTHKKPAAAPVKKEGNAKPAPSAKAAKPGKVEERKKSAETNKATTKKAKVAKPVTAEKPATTAKKVEPTTPEKAKDESASTLINYAQTSDQCLAMTQKGTRCRRKSNLEILDKTINKQKYKFAVCSQHNNASFKPIEGLVKS